MAMGKILKWYYYLDLKSYPINMKVKSNNLARYIQTTQQIVFTFDTLLSKSIETESQSL